MPALEATGRQDFRMCQPALPDLDPAPAPKDVDLAAVERVRVDPCLFAMREALGEHAEEERDHLVHLPIADWLPRDPHRSSCWGVPVCCQSIESRRKTIPALTQRTSSVGVAASRAMQRGSLRSSGS